MKALTTILTLAVLAFSASLAHADEYTFDVESKFVNIAFESRMDVEDILGTSNSAAGFARFDGKSGSFEIKVPVASMKTGIDMRDEHLRSAYWLDAEKHPHIVFKGDSIVDKGNGKYELSGKFSLHGIEKKKTVTVDIRKIAAAKSSKVGLGDNGAVRIRGEFAIKLSDYGVKIPDMAAAKVNDEWSVKISLFAKAK